MKEDRLITVIGVLTVLMSLLMFSVGRFIMGGIVLLIAFAIFWNRGGGRRSDRVIYEKIVKTDLDTDELYGKLKDMDTPLGKPWTAKHKGFDGTSIVFGPGHFRDCVVISRKKDYLDVKHITMLDNIIREPEDEYRFKDVIAVSETDVTPERYSRFAGLKLASVMMVKHIAELIEKLSDDPGAEVPESIEDFRFYYHNSSEGCFRDVEGRDVLGVENSYAPFRAAVLDEDGNEMASVAARAFNRRGRVADSAGFDLLANGEHYGEITRFKEGSEEGFLCETEEGVFRAVIFPACRRANIGCNYMIMHEGRLMAVIGGSPNLLFESCGRCQNDLVLSYDDDYLVLYSILEIFIITLNSGFLK